jgi:CRP/FNR family transcriptional regulator
MIEFKISSVPSCEDCTARPESAFSDLHNGELQRFSQAKSCNRYQDGQVIFREGKYPSGLYCVHYGKIKLTRTGIEGKEHIVRFAKAGDVLGYKALLTNQPFSATATALDDSVVCYVPRDLFFDTIQRNPRLALRMMSILAHELNAAEERILELAQKSVRERLAETLLVLQETFGTEADGATINVNLTREEIAGIVGTATESVIRMLAEFKRSNMIELRGRKIAILQHKALVREAHLAD